MSHKFATLTELISIWESVDTKEFVIVLKHLLEIDCVGVYKKAIISGIFKQLYNDGESNDDMFLADLLVVSEGLQQSNPPPSNESEFEMLPEGLICNIASYLPAKNIFSKWNHVNRKFVQIGLKPQSIKHFEFRKSDKEKVIKYPPQFKYDSTLSKLESLNSTDTTMGGLLMNHIGMKFVKSLTFSMSPRMFELWSTLLMNFFLFFLCLMSDGKNCNIDSADTNIEHVEVNWDDTNIDGFDYYYDPSSTVYRLVQGSHVTHVKHSLQNCDFVDISDDIIEDILQLLIPESPKSIELNKRLKEEISIEQRSKLQS